MEYCKGGSLGGYVSNVRPLDEETIKDVTAFCLLSLSFLHNEKTVHGVFHWRIA